MTIIIIAVVVVLVIAAVSIYNGLVSKRMNVREAWSGIDVQLKRKGNVIPNLVDVIKMQTNYEGDLLEKLTKARTGITEGSNGERVAQNDAMSGLMMSVYAVAENYPQLGANESFHKIMEQVADCEDKITYARNRYNISVSTYNTAVETFPGTIFAGIFGFKPEEFFEIPQEKRDEVDNMRIKDIE